MKWKTISTHQLWTLVLSCVYWPRVEKKRRTNKHTSPRISLSLGARGETCLARDRWRCPHSWHKRMVTQVNYLVAVACRIKKWTDQENPCLARWDEQWEKEGAREGEQHSETEYHQLIRDLAIALNVFFSSTKQIDTFVMRAMRLEMPSED